MVELKNIAEDIVIDLIDTLDESKKDEINKNQKREITAFVLNRIKPMYITSNKGFTNIIVKFQNDPQFLADIMMHISEALKVVRKSYSSVSSNTADKLDISKPYFIIPKIYGKVISSKQMMPLPHARISLYIDSKLSNNFFESWKNPVEIIPRDEGIFSFAPLPILTEPPYNKKVFTISIIIENDDKKYEKLFNYECTPSLLSGIEGNFHENVLQIEDIYVPF